MKYYRISKVNSVGNSVLVYNNGKHYYVDLKDKIISPKSENDNIIKLGSKFYCVNKDDNNYNLTDCKTNKTICSYKSIPTKYNNVYEIVKFNGQEYVVFKNKDKYALFNITKNKIVFESKERIYLKDEYYEVGQHEKTKYYSYLTNKKFYEYEKK